MSWTDRMIAALEWRYESEVVHWVHDEPDADDAHIRRTLAALRYLATRSARA